MPIRFPAKSRSDKLSSPLSASKDRSQLGTGADLHGFQEFSPMLVIRFPERFRNARDLSFLNGLTTETSLFRKSNRIRLEHASRAEISTIPLSAKSRNWMLSMSNSPDVASS